MNALHSKRFAVTTIAVGLLLVPRCRFEPSGREPLPDVAISEDAGAGADARIGVDAFSADTGATDEPDSGTSADVGRDAGFPGPDATSIFADASPTCDNAWSYDPIAFDPCAQYMPAVLPALDLGPGLYTYDTATGEFTDENQQTSQTWTFGRRVQADGRPLHITSVFGLTLAREATLVVVGSEPWALAVHGEARILGEIQAKNADEDRCSADLQGGEARVNRGAGGGGGGGHAALGGRGGSSENGGAGAPAGAVNIPGPLAPPVRSGCPGGAGGNVFETDDGRETVAFGGLPGPGGGAIIVSVRDRLSIEGAVLATGAAGGGGDVYADDDDRGATGGGGGGSGGDIVLEAVHVAVSGEICAGGGAGGSGATFERTGIDGVNGRCAAVTPEPGSGGLGGQGSIDGPGGDGEDTDRPIAGGGGGGSAGRIQIRFLQTLTSTGRISPAAAIR